MWYPLAQVVAVMGHVTSMAHVSRALALAEATGPIVVAAKLLAVFTVVWRNAALVGESTNRGSRKPTPHTATRALARPTPQHLRPRCFPDVSAPHRPKLSVVYLRWAFGRPHRPIARELHDIVAHSVSVMTIQAGAIEQILTKDPEKARAAASSIRQTGRQALNDLRSLLGLLRAEGPLGDTLTPQPGLSDVKELVEQVRLAGVDVSLDVYGDHAPLPPAVDLSAFRVVQSAPKRRQGRAS